MKLGAYKRIGGAGYRLGTYKWVSKMQNSLTRGADGGPHWRCGDARGNTGIVNFKTTPPRQWSKD